MTEVGIVGAGVLGRLLAWRLVTAGISVKLFEKGDGSGTDTCSWVAAGMIAPYAELEKAEPFIATLGVESLKLWQEWLPDLDGEVYFQCAGSLVVAHARDAADLDAFGRTVARHLDDPTVMEVVAGSRLGDLEPDLAGRFQRGLFFPGEGHIEPRQLLPVLRANLPEGVLCTHSEVQAMGPGWLEVKGIRHGFDYVIDTRGLEARDDLPLRGVRGEVIRFHAPEVKLTRPVRLMHPRYPLYIVPRPNDTYIIGATSIESDHDGPITVRSSLELLSAVYSLHSGFAEAAILETSVGLRPALTHNQPRLFHEPGLLRLNGLYRHGYLAAPAVVDETRRLLLGQEPKWQEWMETSHAHSHS